MDGAWKAFSQVPRHWVVLAPQKKMLWRSWWWMVIHMDILYYIYNHCIYVIEYEYVYTHTVSYLILEPFWIVIFYDHVAKKKLFKHAFWRAALAHFPEDGCVFFLEKAVKIACNNSIEVSPPNKNHSVKILIWLNWPNLYLLSWARLRRLVAEGCSISSFEDLVELPSLKTLEPWSLGTAMSKGKLPCFFS